MQVTVFRCEPGEPNKDFTPARAIDGDRHLWRLNSATETQRLRGNDAIISTRLSDVDDVNRLPTSTG